MVLKLSPEERVAIMGVIEEKQKAIGVGMEARREEDMLTYEQHIAELGDIRGEERREARDIRKFEREKVTLDPLTPEDAKEIGLVATGYDPETGLTEWGREKPVQLTKLSYREKLRIKASEEEREKVKGMFEGTAKAVGFRERGAFNEKTKTAVEFLLPKYNQIRLEQGLPKLEIIQTKDPVFQRWDRWELREIQGAGAEVVSPEMPTFNNIEEAEAANLPIGTEVTIQGRRAIIE